MKKIKQLKDAKKSTVKKRLWTWWYWCNGLFYEIKWIYYTTIYDIQNNYFTDTIYRDTLTNINNNINEIKYAPIETEIRFNILSEQFDYFIKTDL